MESIWLRPERSARGPVPEHSRAEIARAAMTLADQGGLAAVTMRSVAAAIGTGPASLYRYVGTRDEILELMADEAAGEYRFSPSVPPEPQQPQKPQQPHPGDPLSGLLQLARQARRIYQRHPWLIDLPAVGVLPGPNAIAYTEQVLAVLDTTGLDHSARLETVGIFTGLVRLLARTEADQQRAGQQLADWQGALAGYLIAAVADGRYPHLAAALSGQGGGQATGAAAPGPAAGPAGRPPGPAGPDDPFDRTLTRILAGLLAPPGSQPPDQ
ncbi:MAG TPA: TetR/AcrR family transcriptional regulator [Streptosporangiaceae bacterium]